MNIIIHLMRELKLSGSKHSETYKNLCSKILVGVAASLSIYE